MIGLDTSHVTAFTEILHDSQAEHHVPGARVVAAFPGGSPDFPLSWSRVVNYTNELRDRFGVPILESVEAVAAAADLVMITSLDGRVHLAQFQQILPYQRPTFVDKPLAISVSETQQILQLARDAQIPVMSCSAMRYADPLVKILQTNSHHIQGCDVVGLLTEEPTQRDLFFYGIHSMEIVVTVMGVGCQEVRAVRTNDADLITIVYGDGRLASIRGIRHGDSRFWITLHREGTDPVFLDLDRDYSARPRYVGLLNAILRSLPKGRSDVSEAEMLEVMKMLEAAVTSRNDGGRSVYLTEIEPLL